VRRPPLLGEHTDELLGQLCNLDAADLQRLHRDGIA
jgi:crotonobetainyl-CoA:carnitine CoA-transferase CaiB-like acyl-CoA transferase